MEAAERVKKTMSTCDICLRPCHAREALCEICQETVRHLARIWQERPNLRSGAIVAAQESAQITAAVAPGWQLSTPPISLYQLAIETIRTRFIALLRRVRVLPAQAAGKKIAASPASRPGCYLNLGV